MKHLGLPSARMGPRKPVPESGIVSYPTKAPFRTPIRRRTIVYLIPGRDDGKREVTRPLGDAAARFEETRPPWRAALSVSTPHVDVVRPDRPPSWTPMEGRPRLRKGF